MRDQLAGGRVFLVLTIVDHYTRESPAIEVDLSLPGARVAQVLDRLAGRRGLPRSIRWTTGRSSRVGRWTSGHTGEA